MGKKCLNLLFSSYSSPESIMKEPWYYSLYRFFFGALRKEYSFPLSDFNA